MLVGVLPLRINDSDLNSFDGQLVSYELLQSEAYSLDRSIAANRPSEYSS